MLRYNTFRLSRAIMMKQPRPAVVIRSFSSENGSEARDKLRAIMETYRQQNYTQCLPSRFVKQVLNAADKNNDGVIDVSEVQTLLSNIGASGQLTEDEIKSIMEELVDGSSDEVPRQNLYKLLLGKTI